MTQTQPSLGVQLYSVREHLGGELPQTLTRLAGMGFSHVEPYDIVSDTAGLKRAIGDAGLRATTAHAKITALGSDVVLPAVAELGLDAVIVPWVEPTSLASRDGVLAVADAINREVDAAAREGIRLGYHNHDFEFSQHVDGVPAYELLVANLDPRVVLELDTYWASVGGADVFELLPRLGERVRFLHVKNQPRRADDRPIVGVELTGRMAEVVALAHPHLELAVVELVLDDAELWPALEADAAFFLGQVSA